MRNFQDTIETHKRSFISAFSICMTVSLKPYQKQIKSKQKKVNLKIETTLNNILQKKLLTEYIYIV